MGWPFLLVPYPSSWTLTGCKGHLCWLGDSPFLLILCTKNQKSSQRSAAQTFRKQICFWVTSICIFIGILRGAWNIAFSLSHDSSLWLFCHWTRFFMDSIAMDHSILCPKLIALWSLKGKISALLKAMISTWANLTWDSSEGNLTGSSPGNAKLLHLSLSWKPLFMLSGRLSSTMAWKGQDRVSWGQVRTPPGRLGCLYL